MDPTTVPMPSDIGGFVCQAVMGTEVLLLSVALIWEMVARSLGNR